MLLPLLLLVGVTFAESIPELNNDLPSFVTRYAPILHLHTQEPWLPSDITAQLVQTIPEVNRTIISNKTYTLDDLAGLNELGGDKVYLTSKEGIQALPSWFNGISPDENGVVSNGKTCAIVIVEKPDVDGGVVDVFYFYFYAYNQGNHVKILAVDLGEYGNHVGDWERTMIRFKENEPQVIWLSQHAFGEAFTYNSTEKQGDRPVVYVGNGTHANWGKTGPYDHTLQLINLPDNGVLTDYTDEGTLYDPTQSALFYGYNMTSKKFTSYDSNPVDWLYFRGQWGDQQLPDSASGQSNLAGNARYSGGPNGPMFKDLGRKDVCLTKEPICFVNPVLTS